MVEGREFQRYSRERNIALWDNSSIEFLRKAARIGICTENLLTCYDVILVPDWVMHEMEDSQYRVDYIHGLMKKGLPIYRISERKYGTLAKNEEGNLYHIVQAAISKIAVLQRWLNQNVRQDDELDLEDSAIWMRAMYEEWPSDMQETVSGRRKKKNAGEISLTVLAEVFSWYYPGIASLTILTQDADAYDFVTHSNRQLANHFRNRVPVSITFKSNDFFLCQLYRTGRVGIDQVSKIRTDIRKVTYVKKQPDEAVALITERMEQDSFENLLQDKTAEIIF